MSPEKEIYKELMDLAYRLRKKEQALRWQGEVEKARKAAALGFMVRVWAREWT